MLKKVLPILLLLVIISSLNACQKKEQLKTTELTFAIENDITNLDPIKSQEPYSLQVIGQIFEGLVTLNGKNELVPALAESWTHNSDYTVWQFKIRKGVFFHEDESFGPTRTREVNAEDARYSFQRIVSKESYPAFVISDAVAGVAEYQAGKTKDVSGFRVIDPYTFEIRLQQSEPTFLHRITSPWFCVFPKEIVEKGPDVFGRVKAVGTGPFRLVQRSDTEVILEKNPKYWQQTNGNVQRLRFKVVKNEQIRLTELKNGNITMMRLPLALMSGVLVGGGITGQQEYPLKSPFSKDFTVKAFPTFNTHFIGFNCDKLDIHLRRAISLAINRKEVLDTITFGSGILSTGTVPIGLLGYQPPYQDDLYNVEMARQELKQAKINPRTRRIELLVHEKDNTEQLGQLIQGQLKQIGLETDIKKLDYNTVVDRMIKGETEAFALALEYVFSAPEPILNNIFNSAKIPVPNFWHYRNSKVDAELNRLRSVGDRTEANAISRNIEKQIIDDTPAVFLYQLRNLVVFRKDISNVAFNGHSIPLLWEARIE